MNSYSDDEIANRIAQLNQIVEPLTGLAPEENSIRFNPNSKQIEILFNGNPENQLKIFQALFKANFQVLEFSVPKAGLLEDLYLKFMDEEDSNQKALIQANQNIASNSKSKTKTKAKTKTKTKTPGVKV